MSEISVEEGRQVWVGRSMRRRSEAEEERREEEEGHQIRRQGIAATKPGKVRKARAQTSGMRTRFASRPVTKKAGQQEPPPGECFEPALEEPRGNEPPETETCSPTPGGPTRSTVARGNSPNATGVRPRPPRLSPQGTHIFRSRFRIELRRLKGL